MNKQIWTNKSELKNLIKPNEYEQTNRIDGTNLKQTKLNKRKAANKYEQIKGSKSEETNLHKQI